MASTQAGRGGVSWPGATAASDVVTFADRLLRFAEQACGCLPWRRVFALPGTTLDIRFSAPDCAALCDLAYLPLARPAGAQRAAAIAVLDYESVPALPRWIGRSPDFHGVTAALAEHGLQGAYDARHLTWDIYDPRRALGVRAMHATSLRPPWEPSFPLRLLLHWAGRTCERGLIHAGSLGHRGRGVLLAGAGGAGKSGTTLSGILNGLTSAGDDYVAVSAAGGTVEARPVLRRMKQDERGLRRLGLAAGQGALAGPCNWQGKVEFDFEALSPGARAERLAMAAILIPHIARSPSTTFRPARGREAMLAMAPSSLYQLHGSWREDFGLIAAIARALPAFHLDLSEDPAEIAAAIRHFIVDGILGGPR